MQPIAPLIFRDLCFHAAKRISVTHDHDLAFDVDADLLERFVIVWQSVVCVDDWRGHITARSVAVEEWSDLRMRRRRIAGHDCFVSAQSLSARRYQLEHARRIWIVEPNVVLLQVGRKSITAQLIANVDGGVVVFFCAGDVRFERETSQVFACRLRIGNGAKLFFPATLGRRAFGAESVDCVL